jgi:fibronectin-binding autotransporter adhesin
MNLSLKSFLKTVAAFAVLLTASSAQAQTVYYWNGANTSASPAAGGTGTWSTNNAWRTVTDTGVQGTWAAGTGGTNVGFLAGTAGTVTLATAGSTNFTGSSLTVETSGYTVTSTANSRNLVMTGALTLDPNVAFTANHNSTGQTWGFGSITGGSGSSLTLSGAATINNANRVNLSAASGTSNIPSITLSGTAAGPTGFVATGLGHTLSSNILNDSATSATMLGATSNNSLNYSGILSGSAHLQISAGQDGGAGIVTLSGVNTFTGDTYTNNATNAVLRIGIANALPAMTNVFMGQSAGGGTKDNGGSIDLNGFDLAIASLTAGASTRGIANNTAALSTLTIGKASGSTTFGGAIGTVANTNLTTQSNNIALIKTGNSSQALSGSNTYTGGTTINGGDLRIDAVAALPTTGGITVNDGGQLRLRVANGTFGGGSQTLTLNGNGAGGGTDDGALRSTQAGVVYQGPVELASNSRIRANGSNTLELTGAVSGAGRLEFIGGGTLTLSGNNTFSGGTTINAGTLSVASDAALGDAAGGITLGGGTLEMTSGFTLGSGRTITATANTTSTLAVTTGTGTFGGAFTGSGNLDKAGAGWLVVGNASPLYSGTFAVSAGTLEVTGSGAFANAFLSQSGGTLLLAPAGGGDVVIPDLAGGGGETTIVEGATAVVGGPGNSSYNGQIRGQGGLRKEGAGDLRLNGNNDFAGETRIAAGRLKLGPNGALSATPLIEIDSSAIFDLSERTTALILGTGQRLGGRGSILGDLEFGSGSQLTLDPTQPNAPLLVGSGTISFAEGFGIANIFGLDASTPEGTYTLLNETAGGAISFTNLANVDIGNAYTFPGDSGKTAYFKRGSLQVVVVPEPSVFLLGGLGLASAGLVVRRRRQATAEAAA